MAIKNGVVVVVIFDADKIVFSSLSFQCFYRSNVLKP